MGWSRKSAGLPGLAGERGSEQSAGAVALRKVARGLPERVADGGVGTGREQRLEQVIMPEHRSAHQRRAVPGGGNVDVGAGAEQPGDDRGVASVNRTPERSVRAGRRIDGGTRDQQRIHDVEVPTEACDVTGAEPAREDHKAQLKPHKISRGARASGSEFGDGETAREKKQYHGRRGGPLHAQISDENPLASVCTAGSPAASSSVTAARSPSRAASISLRAIGRHSARLPHSLGYILFGGGVEDHRGKRRGAARHICRVYRALGGGPRRVGYQPVQTFLNIGV